MNNKGFTLVELLIMMSVLGVLMAVTIPNMNGILSNNRESKLRNDAILMVDRAKVKCQNNKIMPADGGFTVLFLSYLDDDKTIVKGPNGGKYIDDETFVLIKRSGSALTYYVRLIEEKDSKYYGTEIVKFDDLNKETSNYYKKLEVVDDFATGFKKLSLKHNNNASWRNTNKGTLIDYANKKGLYSPALVNNSTTKKLIDYQWVI